MAKDLFSKLTYMIAQELADGHLDYLHVCWWTPLEVFTLEELVSYFSESGHFWGKKQIAEISHSQGQAYTEKSNTHRSLGDNTIENCHQILLSVQWKSAQQNTDSPEGRELN